MDSPGEIELLPLLEKREMADPSRLIGIQFEGNRMTIEVESYPWWNDPTPSRELARVKYNFQEIYGGCYSYSGFILTEHLANDYLIEDYFNDFSICRLKDKKWPFGQIATIYGSEPVKDPLAILVTVEKYIEDFDCPHEVVDFLEYSSLADFHKYTRIKPSTIASGNEHFCSVLESELQRQNVAYSKLNTHIYEPHDDLMVRLGNDHFFCAKALIETGADTIQ